MSIDEMIDLLMDWLPLDKKDPYLRYMIARVLIFWRTEKLITPDDYKAGIYR